MTQCESIRADLEAGNSIEVWKPVVGYEGFYEVSNFGRVKSLWYGRERLRKLWVTKLDYRHVWLCRKDHKHTEKVHRLVAAAFHGPCPKGMECGHLDGNPANNRAENLKWCTHKENHGHQVAHGTLTFGERNGCSKLTEADVISLRWEYKNGASQAEIARKYAVTGGLISMIINKKRWAHI